MNLKGQGALEYLLLIGGAVLVAAIVIALVTGIPGTTPDPATQASCATYYSCPLCVADALCQAKGDDGVGYDDCTVMATAGATFNGCVVD